MKPDVDGACLKELYNPMDCAESVKECSNARIKILIQINYPTGSK